MRQSSPQKQPQKDRRSPWKGKLLLLAPPLGCSASGAAICSESRLEMGIASAGKCEKPQQDVGALNGAAAGLIVGIMAAHAIRWFRRRNQ